MVIMMLIVTVVIAMMVIMENYVINLVLVIWKLMMMEMDVLVWKVGMALIVISSVLLIKEHMNAIVKMDIKVIIVKLKFNNHYLSQ